MSRMEQVAADALRELQAAEDQLVAFVKESKERDALYDSADADLAAKYPAAAKGR